MLATDPLSLVFICCFVVSGVFLLLSSLLGAGLEDMHLGHIGHIGDIGHIGHAGHAGHTPGHASGVMHHTLPQSQAAQDGAHPGAAGDQSAAHAPANPPVWTNIASYLNLYAILTFLFWFGLVGYALKNWANLGSFVASVIGGGVGIIGAVLVTIAMRRLMGRDYGALTAESSDLMGTLATVSMPIRAGGIGEIIYTKGVGGRKSLGARSIDGAAIPRDAEVVIVNYEKGIAQVQTWDRFLSETDDLEDEGLRVKQGGNDSA